MEPRGKAEGRSPGATSPWTVGWGIVSAVSPGWAAYAWTRSDVAVVRGNVGTSIAAAALFMFASAALMVALWWWLARRDRSGLRDAVLRMRIVVALPLLVALLADPTGFLGMRRPLLVLACAALMAWTMPTIPPRVFAVIHRVLGGRRAPLVALGLATAATAMVLLRLALLRHFGLHSRAYDLGIYDNTVWNTLHGHFLGCTLIRSGVHTAAHFDPILALVALPYALLPRAETLVVIQALWVLSAVVPAYLLARDRLGERTGAALVAACLLTYPTVHGVILFEFHSLTLLTPAALWLVYFLDRGRTWPCLAALALVLLVREDAALFAIGVGLYAVLATDRRRLGALVIAIAAAYLVAVKALAMPDSALLMQHSDQAYAYANRYRRLIPEGGGASDALVTLATNPSFVLAHLLTQEKVMALVAFLLPFGLLPLLAGRRLLLCVYGLAFMFLATHPSLYYPLFHYGSVLYPMLLAAVPDGVLAARRRLEAIGLSAEVARRRVHAWLATCAVASGVTMGAFVPNEPFELHTPIPRDLTDEDWETYAWLRAAIDQIPADGSVSTTDRTTPHLSNRPVVHLLVQEVETDWLLFHDDDLDDTDRRFLRMHGGDYEEVDARGPLHLLRHRHP